MSQSQQGIRELFYGWNNLRPKNESPTERALAACKWVLKYAAEDLSKFEIPYHATEELRLLAKELQ